MGWRVLVKGAKGALDPEQVAVALERDFYRPLMPGSGNLQMHDLRFTPKDHDPNVAGTGPFNPAQHNWLRHDKVPVLVLNATTVNTGHGWQFTPTWMGESPWAIHGAADSVPRLQWSWYRPDEGWNIALGRAVAASAAVPGVFAPLNLKRPMRTRNCRSNSWMAAFMTIRVLCRCLPRTATCFWSATHPDSCSFSVNHRVG